MERLGRSVQRVEAVPEVQQQLLAMVGQEYVPPPQPPNHEYVGYTPEVPGQVLHLVLDYGDPCRTASVFGWELPYETKERACVVQNNKWYGWRHNVNKVTYKNCSQYIKPYPLRPLELNFIGCSNIPEFEVAPKRLSLIGCDDCPQVIKGVEELFLEPKVVRDSVEELSADADTRVILPEILSESLRKITISNTFRYPDFPGSVEHFEFQSCRMLPAVQEGAGTFAFVRCSGFSPLPLSARNVLFEACSDYPDLHDGISYLALRRASVYPQFSGGLQVIEFYQCRNIPAVPEGPYHVRFIDCHGELPDPPNSAAIVEYINCSHPRPLPPTATTLGLWSTNMAIPEHITTYIKYVRQKERVPRHLGALTVRNCEGAPYSKKDILALRKRLQLELENCPKMQEMEAELLNMAEVPNVPRPRARSVAAANQIID